MRKAIRAEAAKASGYFANVPCAPPSAAEQMHLDHGLGYPTGRKDFMRADSSTSIREAAII